jgi:hypothetical protein
LKRTDGQQKKEFAVRRGMPTCLLIREIIRETTGFLWLDILQDKFVSSLLNIRLFFLHLSLSVFLSFFSGCDVDRVMIVLSNWTPQHLNRETAELISCILVPRPPASVVVW